MVAIYCSFGNEIKIHLTVRTSASVQWRHRQKSNASEVPVSSIDTYSQSITCIIIEMRREKVISSRWAISGIVYIIIWSIKGEGSPS